MIPQFQQLTQSMQRGHNVSKPPKAEAGDFDAAMTEPYSEEDLQIDPDAAPQTLLAVGPLAQPLMNPKDTLVTEVDVDQIEVRRSAPLESQIVVAAPVDLADAAETLDFGAQASLPLLQISPEFPSALQVNSVNDHSSLTSDTPEKARVSASDVPKPVQLAVTPALTETYEVAAIPLITPQGDLAKTAAFEHQLNLGSEKNMVPQDILHADEKTQRATTAELAWRLRLDGEQPQPAMLQNPAQNSVDAEVSVVSHLPNAQVDLQSTPPISGLSSQKSDALEVPSIIDGRLKAVVVPLPHPVEIKGFSKKSAPTSVLGNTGELVNNIAVQTITPDESGLSPVQNKADISPIKSTIEQKSNADEVFVVAIDRQTPYSAVNFLTENVAGSGVKKAERTQFVPPPEQFVPTVFKQLLPHSLAAKFGAVELSLAPTELGHVKFQIHQQPDSVRVVLTAERPETLDLLRRNAEQLLQEFKHAGFSDASLSFGQWDQRGKPAPTPAEAVAVFDDDFVSDSANLPTRHISPNILPAGQSLDLRL